MSYSNAKLNELAKERASRAAASVVEAWSCPVCYTDGSSSGHVIPKCCTHKICLDCYSNILTKTANCICPVCRAEYRPKPVEPAPVVPAAIPHQRIDLPRPRRTLIITDNFYFGSAGSIRIEM
jgi:hypothetical protein